MGDPRRVRMKVDVPALVGLSAAAARDAALDAGLLAVLQHRAPADAGAVAVTAQDPAPGHRLRRGDHVRIWTIPDDPGDDPGGGGGGHPAPVSPGPTPLAGTKPGP